MPPRKKPATSKRPSLQALTDSLAASGIKKTATPAPVYRHNEINYDALEATVEEMVPVGKQRIQRNTAEAIAKNLDKFKTQVVPKLYIGKASLPRLLKSPNKGVARNAQRVLETLDRNPQEPQPLFLYEPDITVDSNLHAWGAVMRYVFRGQVGYTEFLKVDESELLTKNRSGFIENQKNVSILETIPRVVLYTSTDADTYTPTEQATLSMLFRHWAENRTAVIVVSPRPFNLWVTRLPAEVQPMLCTLFEGNIIEPVRKRKTSKNALSVLDGM